MAIDDPRPGKVAPERSRTVISGNNNSGLIAGRDVRGGITLNSGPPPAAPVAASPASSALPAASAQTLRILFLGSSPMDAEVLRLDAEVREIDLALRQGEFRDRIDLRQQLAVRPTDLQTALLRHRPQILHFSGHGETDGIWFEDEAGQTMQVQGSVIARVLAVFKSRSVVSC